MPDVTKRILTDETGQDIVDALEALTNVVDPNGTTIAAAQKLNNMTTSITVLPAGSTPTSSLTEVNGHFHLTLGVPVELPTVSNTDNGKFLIVNNGNWSATDLNDVADEIGGLMSVEEKEKLDNIDEINIYKDIESTSVASLSDGVDEAPLKTLSVEIEPVQDLHGYENPWPAGGGDNIVPMTLSSIKSANTNGTWNGNAYTYNGITFTVDADDGGNIKSIKVNGNNSGVQFNFTLVDNATILSGMYRLSGVTSGSYTTLWLNMYNTTGSANIGDNLNGSNTITIASDISYRLRITVAASASISNAMVYPMLLTDSSPISSYVPPSNICPISGWTGANVTRTGKNLIPNRAVSGTSSGVSYTVNADGSIALSGTATANGAIMVWEYDGKELNEFTNKQLIISGGYSNNIFFALFVNGSQYVASFGSETAFTLGEMQDTGNLGTTTRAYVYFYNGVNCDGVVIKPIVRLASDSDSTYEPYSGTTLPIAFPQSAGTVYGGTLTVNKDGSGELVVDKGLWTKNTSTMNNNENVPGWKWAGIAELIGTGYNASFNATMNIGTKYSANTIGSNDILFLDKLFYGKTQTEWQALAMDVQIVVVLATPVTYSLTPGQVNTLLGVNNIWADCGDIAITYVTETAGLINTNDKLKIDSIPTKTSDLINDSNYLTSVPTMTGATSSEDGEGGLVPAPTTADVDKFLSGDGTYKSGGLPMVILSYGNSTWSEFINAYKNNVIVYCRASSNANPASGKQTRMAFMAYVNDADNPTQVEFQYYRSMNPTNKSISQMSDQVFVYTLSSNGSWSVISREASIKSVVCDASTGLSATYDKNTGTLTLTAAT